MARTQYYCAASLDGFIAGPDDSLDWLTRYQGEYSGAGAEPMKGTYDEFYDDVGALVMGSATYEFVLNHDDGWPYAGKPAWVLTSRDLPPRGDGEHDIRIGPADVGELHSEMLAAAGGRHLWVVGGGNIASQFADAGLLDELIVTVVPVVLGEGKPLFDRAPPDGRLQLTGTRAFDTGMVELRYDVRS